MAVPEAPTSQELVVRFDELLIRARAVKQSTSVDPPLPVSELVNNGSALFGPISGDKDKYHEAIEGAARLVFYRHLALTSINDPAFVSVWNLLDILQYLGDRELCDQRLGLLLIEDLLDTQSIDGCRTVFTFLESRREAIIADPSKNKELVILRSCNELLRRLSRAEDAVFCGRVYIFLFQTFPLGDKSSVNLRGNFHVENVTTFEDYLKSSEGDADVMEVEAKDTEDDAPKDEDAAETVSQTREAKLSSGEKRGTMDIDELYPVFWSLQHVFSNPQKLFEEEDFKQFRERLETTLAKFKEVPKVIQSTDSDRLRATQPWADDEKDEFASTFNPKFLTSRDLFKLQLSDLAFQRHILVQALILIDFLLTLTAKAKNKPFYLNAQKSMQYPFVLREEDTEWALGIKNSIANYLQDGPDGKFYYRMVDTVLSRDKNWVRWKMENCKPFSRDRVPTKDFLDGKSGARAEVTRKRIAKSLASNTEFLSNTVAEKGLSQLRQASRFALPSPELYGKAIQGIELDLDMADTEEEKRQLEEKKVSSTWRGLRLAAKDRLSSFDRLEYGKGLERLFQPSIEATGEDHAPIDPEDKDVVPQAEHPSVEDQRADQQDVK